MKRSTLAIVVIVVIVLAGGILLAKHKNNNNGGLYGSNQSSNTNNSANASTMPMSQSGNSNSSSKSQATNSVTIQNFAFSPTDITVKVGTKVTWTNNDSTTHTVTETDGQTGPDSGNVSPGSTYSFTFSKAGTYHFHCSIHPEMTGTVTVTS